MNPRLKTVPSIKQRPNSEYSEEQVRKYLTIKEFRIDGIVHVTQDEIQEFWEEVTCNPKSSAAMMKECLKTIYEFLHKPFSKYGEKISCCLFTYMTIGLILKLDGPSMDELHKDAIQVYTDKISNTINNLTKENLTSNEDLYFNPFLDQALKLVITQLNFSEEEETKNYSVVINHICYIPEIRDIELNEDTSHFLNHHNTQNIQKEYVLDFYKYFELLKQYNPHREIEDTVEFTCLFFYWEEHFKDDIIDTDNLSELLKAKADEIIGFMSKLPQNIHKIIQSYLLLIEILIKNYPRFTIENLKILLDGLARFKTILPKPYIKQVERVKSLILSEIKVLGLELFDSYRILFPKLDMYIITEGDEKSKKKNGDTKSKFTWRTNYVKNKVHVVFSSNPRASIIIEYNKFLDNEKNKKRLTYHQLRLNLIFSLINQHNRDMNFKVKDLKNVLTSLNPSEVYEIYTNILELQNNCMILMQNDGQECYTKYIEHLSREILGSSKKKRLTEGFFSIKDNFRKEDYVYDLNKDGEVHQDFLQLYPMAKLYPINEVSIGSGKYHRETAWDKDQNINTVFEDRYEEDFVKLLEKVHLLEKNSAGQSVSGQLRLMVVGGKEELQILVQNLSLIFEENLGSFLNLDLRVYIYPIACSDLAYYMAENDIWYKKHVYQIANLNTASWVPFIGESSSKYNKHKFKGKKNAGNKDGEDAPEFFFGLPNIITEKSIQHYQQCANSVVQVFVYRIDCFEDKPMNNFRQDKPKASFYFCENVIFGEKPIKEFIEKSDSRESIDKQYKTMYEKEKETGKLCQKVEISQKPSNYEQEVSDDDIRVKSQFRHIGVYNVKPKDSNDWGNSTCHPWHFYLRMQTLRKDDFLIKNRLEEKFSKKSTPEVASELRKCFFGWNDLLRCSISFDSKQPFLVDGKLYIGYSHFRIYPVRNAAKQLFTIPICCFDPFSNN